jgi:hypothetical protein
MGGMKSKKGKAKEKPKEGNSPFLANIESIVSKPFKRSLAKGIRS